MKVLLSFLMFLSFSLIPHSQSLSPQGTIERTTKEQLLATLPPFSHETTIPAGSSQLFLTSPSAKYSVFFLRRVTSIGAGGFGSDFCYLQVQESGVSVWESDCTPVSNVNTCNLVFSEKGLEILDGSNSVWDNDVDGENLETLVLIDSGDMQIRDKYGDMVWRASDNPIVNQNCGSVGAPGMAPALPPFAAPIHGGRGPFGQAEVGLPAEQQQPLAPTTEDQLQALPLPQQQQQEEGLNDQPLSHPLSDQPLEGEAAHQQQDPLLDNIPFDSAYSIVNGFKIWVSLVILLVSAMAFFG